MLKKQKNNQFLIISSFIAVFSFSYFSGLILLSLNYSINRYTVLLNVFLGIFLAIVFIKKSQISKYDLNKSDPSTNQARFSKLISKKLNVRHRTLIISIRLLVLANLGIVLFLGLVMPPNNYDSMTYHLPRMESWFQNGTLFGLESQVDRQVWNPQFAESLLLIFKSISPFDHLYNLLQFGALCLILMIFYTWSKGLNSSPILTHLGLMAILSWPMIVLQGATTQNDLVSALYCLICWIFLSVVCQNPDRKAFHLLFGMSAAIAISVKGTSVLFGFLACLVYFLQFLLFRKKVKYGLMALLFPFVLNTPLWIQNLTTFNSIYSPKLPPEYNGLVTNFSPLVFLENLVRAFFMNLAAPIESFNRYLLQSADLILGSIGLQSNNADNTWAGGFVIPFGANEEIATSPASIIVVVAAVFIIWKNWSIIKGPFPLIVCGLFPVMYFFASIYVLRNQPWINRLLVPSFVLLSIFLFINLINFKSINLKVVAIPTVIFFLYSSVFLLYSTDKPLFGGKSPIAGSQMKSLFSLNDEQRLFLSNPDIASQYTYQLQKMNHKNYQIVYVNLGGDSWEYPTWHFFNKLEHKPKIYSYLEFDQKAERQAILCININCQELASSVDTFDVNVIDGMGLSIRNIFELDRTYVFNQSNPIPGGVGWSFPEAWGTWSDRSSASLFFTLSGTNLPQTVYLRLKVRPYIPNPNFTSNLTVELNTTKLGKYTFTENKDYEIVIPMSDDDYFKAKSMPLLNFIVDNPLSPSSFGQSTDSRTLGIGLISIEFSSNKP